MSLTATSNKKIDSANWTPILSPSDEITVRAADAIDGIARALVAKDYETGAIAKLREQTYEEALLYGYLAAAYDDLDWASRAAGSLNTAIDEASQRAAHIGLFGGLAGLGWTVEHVSRLLGQISLPADDAAEVETSGDEEEVDDDEDLNADIDAIVRRQSQHSDSSSCYDLISGLVGFGMYFLERWPKGAAADGISAVFDQLEKLAKPTDAGVAWFSGPELLPEWQRQQCPGGYYNLGVAHGIPGIIHFLSEVSGTDIIDPSRLNKLLDGAVTWLISQQRPANSLSRFSSWIAPGGEESDSRLGWCYGDLGILAVLLQVARRTGRDDWSEFAHELLDHCLAWPLEQAQAEDAPLCHGAVGIAHIFNRIYQSEGDSRCRDAALLWYERTLAMRKPGTGVSGFSALTKPDPQEPVVWEASPAFLDGAGGIALALLAATTSVEPQWDRLLLLSGRTEF